MNYILCGKGIQLTGDAASPLYIAARTIEALFPVKLAETLPERAFEIRINDQTGLTAEGETVLALPGFTAMRTRSGYFLRSGDSWLALDLCKGSASGFLSRRFLNAPLEDQRGLFFMALLLLFASHGRYALHASGMAVNDCGVLLVGESGSGKTTVACSLLRAGWKYLADDAMLLDRGLGGVTALALSGPFHLTSNSLRYFPELAVGAFTPPSAGKRLIDISIAWPGRFLSEVAPSSILFPEITDAETSRLIPLRPAEVCVRLLGTGAGLLADRDSIAGQAGIIAELSRNVPGYRLLHGADVHRSPESLADLIASTMTEPKEEMVMNHACASQF